MKWNIVQVQYWPPLSTSTCTRLCVVRLSPIQVLTVLQVQVLAAVLSRPPSTVQVTVYSTTCTNLL